MGYYSNQSANDFLPLIFHKRSIFFKVFKRWRLNGQWRQGKLYLNHRKYPFTGTGEQTLLGLLKYPEAKLLIHVKTILLSLDISVGKRETLRLWFWKLIKVKDV